MPAVLAYALLVMGLSHALGLLISFGATTLITGPSPPWIRPAVTPVLALLSGLIAILVSLGLFWFLGVRISIAIPILLGASAAYYCWLFHRRPAEWLCYEAGILMGWIFLPPILRLV